MNVSKDYGINMFKLGWGTLAGIAVACSISAPSFAQSTISSGLGRYFRNDPAILTGRVEGNVSIASLAGVNDNCRGFANTAPNHTIKLNDTFPVMDILVYSSNINDDPTMLIKGPNGLVICADDESRGINPQVHLSLHKGEYQIWVGSKTINQPFDYKLSLSEVKQK